MAAIALGLFRADTGTEFARPLTAKRDPDLAWPVDLYGLTVVEHGLDLTTRLEALEKVSYAQIP